MDPKVKRLLCIRFAGLFCSFLAVFAVWFFFFYQTEEDRIRKVFDQLIQCSAKNGSKGMIDEVADVRGIERIFAPSVELKGIPYVSGTYKAKELALRFMQGRKMVNTLSLSVHDLQISVQEDRKRADTEFTLYAQGNGGKAGGGFREAFECSAVLIKNTDNDWVFQAFTGKPVVSRGNTK